MDSTIVYEIINGTNERYRWTRYLNIRVIEDTHNGYINATKMCAMYGTSKNGKPKHFYHWKKTENASKIMQSLQSLGNDNLYYSISHGLDIIKGTYINRDLVVHLATWCGVDIADQEIIHQAQMLQNQLKRQKTTNAGYVYALSAPMFSKYGENVYKVGYTENLTRRLEDFTGIPERKYVYAKAVPSKEEEEKVHAFLRRFRIFDNHELFDVPLQVIKESIDTCLNLQLSDIDTDTSVVVKKDCRDKNIVF